MFKRLSTTVAITIAIFYANPAFADNIDVLIEQFRIGDDVEAQYKECLDGSSKTIEAELQFELETDRLEIEPGDADWALLIAIYSEYYNSICDYLTGDEILNFYKAEFRKRFSAEEIDALIEFHQTPLGQKLNNEWFDITRDYGEILIERQTIDGYEAQRQFEKQIDDFWNYRNEKLDNKSREQDV